MKSHGNTPPTDTPPGAIAGAYGFTSIEVRAILAAVVIAAVMFGVHGLRDQSDTIVPRWITQEIEAVPVASYARSWETQTARGSAKDDPSDPNDRIDINTATRDDLMRLPGIGPKLADRIIAYRANAGPFRSVADLRNVNGIGVKKAAAISGSIAFTSAAQTPSTSDSDAP